MIVRSPHPEIDILEIPVASFALRHAARLADRPALIDGSSGRVLTFGQPTGNVWRAAAGQAARGDRKGDVVAIFAPNALKSAVAFSPVAPTGATPLAAPLARDGPLPAVAIDPRRDVAAILCSSGTTGLPKGGLLTHPNLVASACQFAARCPIGDDTMPAHLPFSHRFGLVTSPTYGPAGGARGVAISRFDPAQLLPIAQDYRATRAFLTPPVLVA